MTDNDLIKVLRVQAIEIAKEGHNGWGNTMILAADRLEEIIDDLARMTAASEPVITINGRLLADSHAATIRVALESFYMDLTRDGLGEDDHGRKMTELYKARIEEIRQVMTEPPKEQND